MPTMLNDGFLEFYGGLGGKIGGGNASLTEGG